MDTDLDPITVANHWPYIRRNLHLERMPAADLALGALAVRQVECDGQPVRFGSRFWHEAGLTGGETGRIRMVLLDLERRGVVGRYRGAGSRANAWFFQPSIVNWRGMPWAGRGRTVEEVVGSCVCRAPRVGIARFPGQGRWLSRGTANFTLSAADHVRRPGLSPVETRDADASRAMPTRRPGLSPVETRDADAAPRPSHLLSRELTVEGANQRFASLTQAAEEATGQTLHEEAWRMRHRLGLLADRLSDEQVPVLVELLRREGRRQFFPRVVETLEELATTPEVKRSGRSLELVSIPGDLFHKLDHPSNPA